MRTVLLLLLLPLATFAPGAHALVEVCAPRVSTDPGCGVHNADIEACTGCSSGSGYMPDGFLGYVHSAGAGVSWTTEAAASGVASMRIDDRPAFATGAYTTPTPVAPGQTYVASILSKAGPGASDATRSDLYLYFLDPVGRQVGLTWRSDPVTGDWTRQSVAATAPATATSARILVYANTAASGTYYVDDVELRQRIV